MSDVDIIETDCMGDLLLDHEVKHAGPGPHPGTGTPQEAHGGDGVDLPSDPTTRARAGIFEGVTEAINLIDEGERMAAVLQDAIDSGQLSDEPMGGPAGDQSPLGLFKALKEAIPVYERAARLEAGADPDAPVHGGMDISSFESLQSAVKDVEDKRLKTPLLLMVLSDPKKLEGVVTRSKRREERGVEPVDEIRLVKKDRRTYAEDFKREVQEQVVARWKEDMLDAREVIAALNTLGAMLVFVIRDPPRKWLDVALGFAAGVMLAASFTSLIIPGIEAGGVERVLVGFFLGVLILDQADRWVPHVHILVTGRERPDPGRANPPLDTTDSRYASVILFIVAITLHNMPEGLAVGVGFGSGDIGNAIALMLAIGIQNIPEGLAVSIAAVNAGFDRNFYAMLAGIRAGVVEIPLAVFGALAITVSASVLPYAMGFAAGGMLFVISDEIVPETHRHGHERAATMGTMIGLAIMLYLDIVFAGVSI